MKTTFVKSVTLVCFFGLIGVFVAYRSGAFDGSAAAARLPQSHNGSVLNTNPVDTMATAQKKDSARKMPYTIPSSKSMVLPPDERAAVAVDSAKTDTAVKRDVIMMSGSKSGPVFRPRPDADTAQTQKPDTVVRRRTRFMGGSKSAPIFQPVTPDSSKP